MIIERVLLITQRRCRRILIFFEQCDISLAKNDCRADLDRDQDPEICTGFLLPQQNEGIETINASSAVLAEVNGLRILSYALNNQRYFSKNLVW